MIKRNLAFAAIVLMAAFSATGGNRLEFIGYDDGQAPVFRYVALDQAGKRKADSCLYRLADGRLAAMDVSIPKGAECLLAKGGVYVFAEKSGGMTKFQFRQGGREQISQLSVKLAGDARPGTVAMGGEYFFVIARSGGDDRSTIFRTKYRAQAKVETFSISGHCDGLLDAEGEHLYYTVQVLETSAPLGYVYQMNFVSGGNKMILGNVYTVSAATAIAPRANLIHTSASAAGDIRAVVADYGKKQYAVSPDYAGRDAAGAFYSYQSGAFVSYEHSLEDIGNWKCLYPSETAEWKPLASPLLKITQEESTGPGYKTGCAGGL